MLNINSCPSCQGTNLDPTAIGQNDITVVCNDCGRVFEVKETGNIKDGMAHRNEPYGIASFSGTISEFMCQCRKG